MAEDFKTNGQDGEEKKELAGTRYWYFRFDENFFDNIEMLNLQQFPIYGYEFVVILLKLYALSTRNKGVLTVKIEIPEDTYVRRIATYIRHDEKIVAMAMRYFIENNFMEVSYKNQEVMIDLPGIKNRIGKSSKEADKKRIERQNRRLALSDAQSEERRNNCKPYGCFKNVWITSEEHDSIKETYKNWEVLINRVSIYKKQFDKNYADDFAAVLSFAEGSGVLKTSDESKVEVKRKQWEKEAALGYPPPDEAKKFLTAGEFERIYEIYKLTEDKTRG